MLNEVVSQRNEAMLSMFSRIRNLTVVYENYPEFLVPEPDIPIPFTYTIGRMQNKVHFQTLTDYNGLVIAFEVLAISNQTSRELLDWLTALPRVPRIVA